MPILVIYNHGKDRISWGEKAKKYVQWVVLE